MQGQTWWYYLHGTGLYVGYSTLNTIQYHAENSIMVKNYLSPWHSLFSYSSYMHVAVAVAMVIALCSCSLLDSITFVAASMIDAVFAASSIISSHLHSLCESGNIHDSVTVMQSAWKCCSWVASVKILPLGGLHDSLWSWQPQCCSHGSLHDSAAGVKVSMIAA